MDNRQHTKKPSRMAEFLAKAAATAAKALHINRTYQQAIGQALPRTYFQGLDEDDAHAMNKLARRRAKNKVARKSRRINRIAAKR